MGQGGMRISMARRANGPARLLMWPVLAVIMTLLAACNSGSLTEGLESARPNQPMASVGNPGTAQQQPQSLPQAQPATGQADGQMASVAGTTRAVAFLPVSNAPQGAVTNLASSIRQAASNNGIQLVASVESGAEYQVKGYFSALEDGGGTLLVYVWDVLDRNNKRVYRINGQEQSNAKAADPWSAVTPEMMDRVARSTLSQLRTWLASRG